ncbi:MAG: hypothetical protein E7668_07235 [Ruminococcaceae bacterium]|nr:hypothetical protein [Oscillospiraceae bacterium]
MKKSGGDLLWDACRKGKLDHLLEQYILSCKEENKEGAERTASSVRKGKRISGHFPNLAGFCRAKGISMETLAELEKEFPEQVARFYVILEDEALNSGLPPPILSAYLKKRLGYEREAAPSAGEAPEIRFEHDILKDGE